VVECGGLENRCGRKSIEGSNPSASVEFSDKENSTDTQASVKRPDKGRSERSARSFERNMKGNRMSKRPS
jgi:hypothetical protein